jgi:hypothetical protein
VPFAIRALSTRINSSSLASTALWTKKYEVFCCRFLHSILVFVPSTGLLVTVQYGEEQVVHGIQSVPAPETWKSTVTR